MNSIVINTTSIKNSITELNNAKRYYSNKKSTFANSNFGYCTKLSSYLGKVQKIYQDISTNIENISDYLTDYISDVESLERLSIGGNGYVKADGASTVIAKYKNTLISLQLDSALLFDITSYLHGRSETYYDAVDSIAHNTATVGICALSFLEGVINVAEMLVDGGAMVTASACSIFGLDEQANAIGNFVKEDWSKDLYYSVVSSTGLDQYANPDSTAANISSMVGNIAGMIGVSVLTGGAAANIFGAGTEAAATFTTISGGLVGAAQNIGSESEAALQQGATLEDAEMIGAIAGVTGAITGGISGKLDAAARGIGANLGKVGLGQICKYALASFGVGASEPIINEMAHTIIYRNDEESGLLANFLNNATEDNLLLQMGLAGLANSGGTIVNGIGGIRRYNSLSKQIETAMSGSTTTVIQLADVSEISPDLINKITDPTKVTFKVGDDIFALSEGELKQIDGNYKIGQQFRDIVFGNDLKITSKNFMELSNTDRIKYINNANLEEIDELLRSKDLLDDLSLNTIKSRILDNQEGAFFGKGIFNRNGYIESLILSSPDTYNKLSNATIFSLINNNNSPNIDSLLEVLYHRIDIGENIFADNYGMNEFFGNKRRVATTVFSKMSNEYQLKVRDNILNIFKTLPENLQEMSRSGYDLFDQANISRAYREGRIDEKGIIFLSKLYASNENYIKGMNFNMLNQGYLNDWGESFLTSIINNTDLSNKISYLHDNSPDLYNALLQIFKRSQEDNSLYTLYPKIISMTNFIFENQKSLTQISTDILSGDSLINYTLYNSLAHDHDIKIMTFSSNYDETFSLECDKKFNEIMKSPKFEALESFTLEDLKRVFYNKYFSNTPENVKSLIAKFETSLDTVRQFDSDSTQIIDFLKYVESIRDRDTLSNLYNSMEFKITPEEFLSLDNSLRQAYAKTYVEALTKTDQSLRSMLESSNVITQKINGNNIKIINVGDEFSFIVRSSDSGLVSDAKKLVDDSYIKSWYQTDNPSNHILAASFITEKNIGSCPVNNDGVLYGFTKIKDSQIAMLSMTDINSNINSVGYSSGAQQIFIAADEMSNYTRRIYNEIDLEMDGVKPDFIIAYSDFTDRQLESAYKAAAEWNIPIVKIDKVELATSQANNINALMDNFKHSNDIKFLKEALDLYESNCSGYKLNSYVREGSTDHTSAINNKIIYDLGLFDSVKIENDIMDYIQILSEKESNYQEVDNVIKIFEDIKYKYSLSNDNNKLLANTKSNIDIDSLLSMLKEIRK